uniref:Uncharacterized protein n=1 Tax=Denticeps clupeoides TaxID=299321 RepID=A0AAY4CYF2_9TELE
MVYLAHTAHPQYAAMWLGAVGWILTVVTTGLVEWRVWVVADVSVITSGMVWVGIWRVCFFSHILVSPELRVMFCQKMRLSDAFTPWEIAVAQVLMMVAAVLGLLASASVIYGLRNIFFGLDKKIHILVAFSLGGVLYLLTAVCSLIPLCLNFNSVVQNQTIAFPDIFHVPPAPVEQHVGGGIAVGISASIMMVTSGIVKLQCLLSITKTLAVLLFSSLFMCL